MKMVGSS